MVTDDERRAFEAEAARLGLTVSQYAEVIVQGATDALEDAIAQWLREQESEAA